MTFELRTLKNAKYSAPLLHALLFTVTLALYAASSDGMDGPAGPPFIALFWLDFPLSAVAFGVIFTRSDVSVQVTALAAWAALGTLWWYLLGMSIDAWIRRFHTGQKPA